jgi:transposase InsO family protein
VKPWISPAAAFTHEGKGRRRPAFGRSDGIRARPKKPFRPKTTQPDHAATPSPNLLAKADSPQRPGEQLVSDVTYVPTREGWMYLAVVIDLFSRTVMGWDLSDDIFATGTIRPSNEPPDRDFTSPSLGALLFQSETIS